MINEAVKYSTYLRDVVLGTLKSSPSSISRARTCAKCPLRVFFKNLVNLLRSFIATKFYCVIPLLLRIWMEREVGFAEDDSIAGLEQFGL